MAIPRSFYAFARLKTARARRDTRRQRHPCERRTLRSAELSNLWFRPRFARTVAAPRPTSRARNASRQPAMLSPIVTTSQLATSDLADVPRTLPMPDKASRAAAVRSTILLAGKTQKAAEEEAEAVANAAATDITTSRSVEAGDTRASAAAAHASPSPATRGGDGGGGAALAAVPLPPTLQRAWAQTRGGRARRPGRRLLRVQDLPAEDGLHALRCRIAQAARDLTLVRLGSVRTVDLPLLPPETEVGGLAIDSSAGASSLYQAAALALKMDGGSSPRGRSPRSPQSPRSGARGSGVSVSTTGGTSPPSARPLRPTRHGRSSLVAADPAPGKLLRRNSSQLQRRDSASNVILLAGNPAHAAPPMRLSRKPSQSINLSPAQASVSAMNLRAVIEQINMERRRSLVPSASGPPTAAAAAAAIVAAGKEKAPPLPTDVVLAPMHVTRTAWLNGVRVPFDASDPSDVARYAVADTVTVHGRGGRAAARGPPVMAAVAGQASGPPGGADDSATGVLLSARDEVGAGSGDRSATGAPSLASPFTGGVFGALTAKSHKLAVQGDGGSPRTADKMADLIAKLKGGAPGASSSVASLFSKAGSTGSGSTGPSGAGGGSGGGGTAVDMQSALRRNSYAIANATLSTRLGGGVDAVLPDLVTLQRLIPPVDFALTAFAALRDGGLGLDLNLLQPVSEDRLADLKAKGLRADWLASQGDGAAPVKLPGLSSVAASSTWGSLHRSGSHALAGTSSGGGGPAGSPTQASLFHYAAAAGGAAGSVAGGGVAAHPRPALDAHGIAHSPDSDASSDHESPLLQHDPLLSGTSPVRRPPGARPLRKERSSFPALGGDTAPSGEDESGSDADARRHASGAGPPSARRRQFSLRVLQQSHSVVRSVVAVEGAAQLGVHLRPQPPPPQPSRASVGSRPSLGLRLRTPHSSGTPMDTVMDDIAGVAVTPVLSARDRHASMSAAPAPAPQRRPSAVVAMLERAAGASQPLPPGWSGSGATLPPPDRPDPRLHLHMSTPEPEPWLPYTNRKLDMPPVHWPGMSEVRKEHESEVASKLTRVSGGIRSRLVNVSSMFRTRSHHTRGFAAAADAAGGGADAEGGVPTAGGKGGRKGQGSNRGASAAHADFRRFIAMPVLERGFGSGGEGDVPPVSAAPGGSGGLGGPFSSAALGPSPLSGPHSNSFAVGGVGGGGGAAAAGMGAPKTSFASMVKVVGAGDGGGGGAVTRRAPIVAAPLPSQPTPPLAGAPGGHVRPQPHLSPSASFRSGDGSSSGGGAPMSTMAGSRPPVHHPPRVPAAKQRRSRGRRASGGSRRQLLRKPSRSQASSPDTQGSNSSLSPSTVPARVRDVLSLFADLGTLSPKLAGYTYRDLVSGKPVRHGMRLGLPDLFELARVANDRMLQVSPRDCPRSHAICVAFCVHVECDGGGGGQGGVEADSTPPPAPAAHAGCGGARPSL